MEYIVRRADKKDVENIAKLEAECFSTEGWSSASVSEGMKLPDRHFFVAVDGDNHLGHACITNICGEGEITNVAVDSMYRRAGIGRKLMEALFACGDEKNIKAYTLEVREHNEQAIKLYECFGFVSEGIRPHFYSDPDEGAMIMWKR